MLLATATLQARVVKATDRSPTIGPVIGGALVTIRGVGFIQSCNQSAPPRGQTILQVPVGGTSAASFVVVSDTVVQAVTPARTAGLVDVRVDHVLGSPGLPNAFTLTALPTPMLTNPTLLMLAATLLLTALIFIRR